MHKEEVSKLFKVLSDESRLKIVKTLYHNEELYACKLLDVVDRVQSTLSHHMSILVESGLVNARKESKWIHYSINKELVDELMGFIATPCKCTFKN